MISVKVKVLKIVLLYGFRILVVTQGFEPVLRGSKPRVLPLHYVGVFGAQGGLRSLTLFEQRLLRPPRLPVPTLAHMIWFPFSDEQLR